MEESPVLQSRGDDHKQRQGLHSQTERRSTAITELAIARVRERTSQRGELECNLPHPQ